MVMAVMMMVVTMIIKKTVVTYIYSVILQKYNTLSLVGKIAQFSESVGGVT